jgi:hypothetical protein
MIEAPTARRPFYPNVFVQIAAGFVAAMAGKVFFAVTPDMPALLRTIITLAVVFGSPFIFYWLRRRWRR